MNSITPFIQVTELPSHFLSYPKDVQISYQPYSFGEIEQLSQLENASIKKRIEFAAKGIKVEGMDLYDLEPADFTYILILRQMSTFNTQKFNLEFNCPHCREANKKEVLTSEIEFNEISDRIQSLPVELALSTGIPLQVGGLTLRDQIELDSLENPTLLDVMARRIKNFSVDEAKDIIRHINNGEDIDLLQFLNEELDFNTQFIVTECDHCKKADIKVELGDMLELATPFRRDSHSVLDRILPSKKPDSQSS